MRLHSETGNGSSEEALEQPQPKAELRERVVLCSKLHKTKIRKNMSTQNSHAQGGRCVCVSNDQPSVFNIGNTECSDFFTVEEAGSVHSQLCACTVTGHGSDDEALEPSTAKQSQRERVITLS